MATVRCYLPLSVRQLEALSRDRHLRGPLDAFAVTEAVRAANPAGVEDEWEYAALQQAARGQAEAGQPILIAAIDLAKADVTRDDKAVSASVHIGDLDLPRVASLHLGDDVVAGQAGVLEAGTVQVGSAIELSWYDTTELDHVVELAQASSPPAKA
ncbi:MAG: hypothetical protein Q4P07_08155 [Ornithinimicrobium sp.]|uniref:DUF6912 family protein n=1 Tax=Ornithinimicrobium sp. TaxID=1977084 RepID=UPI0026DECAED|nr:hypothetical protein [Ornithinimicrobium sp.]MDO5740104.1 hypothetical protein [Ornithinimicrobium sp.]